MKKDQIKKKKVAKPQQKKGKKKKSLKRFTIDCSHPVEDGILEPADFVSCCLIDTFVARLAFMLYSCLQPSCR